MADLNTPVQIRTMTLSASSLPAGLSMAYQQYILGQAADMTNIAQKANAAGSGAQDALDENTQQNIELADHEGRITGNTYAIQLIEVRVTTAEGQIVTLRSDVDYLLTEVVSIESELTDHDTRINQAEDDISDIQADYVSKSEPADQVLMSSLGVKGFLSVDGVKVIGPRQTGWTAGTGAPNKGAFNADQAFTVSAAYSQAEIQAIATALVAERQRTLALEQVLRNNGLID
ncbi:phage tail protein [Leclercia adecarboxylata]|uniref:phage tail protein n=1 Tax=Leclercia adecarboxylata TaxID=83655 RepID=UPI0030198A5D